MKIFYLYYEVRPSPGSDAFEVLGGAFVSCWIQSFDQASAEGLAAQDIGERGFEAVSLLEARAVSRQDYSSDEPWLKYLDQAEEEGESYLYNGWPVAPQEHDSIH